MDTVIYIVLLYCVCTCVCVCVSARLCQYQCATSDRAYSSTDSSFAQSLIFSCMCVRRIVQLKYCEHSKCSSIPH